MKNNNDNQLFWVLVVRVLDGYASDEETRTFRELLLSDGEFMDNYMHLKNNWDNLKQLEDFEKVDLEKKWEKVSSRIAGSQSGAGSRSASISINDRKKPLIYRVLPYAAVVTLLVAVSALLVWYVTTPSLTEGHYTRVEAPVGSKAIIDLPDGSNVSLNAGSTLIYSDAFNVENRQIVLEGEAFFEIAEKDLPFIVTAHEIRIKALGTSFNLKAYSDDDYIEATLVTGLLLIERADEEGPYFEDIILEPNQKATFFREEERVSLVEEEARIEDPIVADVVSRPIVGVEVARKLDITPEIGWKDGVIFVESEPLHKLARRLERLYNVSFVFKDKELKSYRYSGRLRELTLEQVLQAMKLTSPIDYSIEDQVVTIRENPLTRYKYLEYY